MKSGIYIIENSGSPVRVYIGSAIDLKTRARAHMNLLSYGKHHSKKLQNSYNKHGKDNFRVRTLFYCAPDMLIFYEQRAIDAFKSSTMGYNVNHIAGSNLGKKFSDESRARMSAAKKGVPCPQGGITRTGRIATSEHRARISIAHKGKKKSPKHRESLAISATGRILSEETKRKMSVSRVGKKQSQETIAKRINSRLNGKKHDHACYSRPRAPNGQFAPSRQEDAS